MNDQTPANPISIIIPSLNSPILDRVIDAILGQETAATIAEILVVGKDEPGLLQSSLP